MRNQRLAARRLRVPSLIAAGILGAAVAASPVAAQTDYYNTDSGRPLTIEDAYPTERYAFEIQLAPLRLERARGGIYQWEFEPELAYGIFPRTHIEIGAPIQWLDAGSGSRSAGLAGIELSMLHNLNVETSIPALAIVGDVLLPAGKYAPEKAVFSAKGIATKTFGFARFHANGKYSFGDEGEEPVEGPVSLESREPTAEVSRWVAGISVDKTFPLHSTLIGAEVFAEKARFDGADAEWNAAVGVRRQLSPEFNVDMGLGKRLTGDERSWFVTFGLARAFAIRSLLP